MEDVCVCVCLGRWSVDSALLISFSGVIEKLQLQIIILYIDYVIILYIDYGSIYVVCVKLNY